MLIGNIANVNPKRIRYENSNLEPLPTLLEIFMCYQAKVVEFWLMIKIFMLIRGTSNITHKFTKTFSHLSFSLPSLAWQEWPYVNVIYLLSP